MLDHQDSGTAMKQGIERVPAEKARTNSTAPMKLYFHLENGACEIPDAVGLELDSADDVRSQSLIALEEISRETPQLFEYFKGWRVKVADQSASVLFSLALD
jgi:hypothetical protein